MRYDDLSNNSENYNNRKLKDSRTVNLFQMFEEYILFKQAEGAGERTIKDYRTHIGNFFKILKNFKSFKSDFKPDFKPDFKTLRSAVIQFLSGPIAPSYRNTKLKALRAFFNWCVREGYLSSNPTEGIKKAKEDTENIRHVELDDVKKLLSAPDKKTYAGLRDYCLILVQIDTGARPGELLQVRPSDLNLQSRELYIRSEVSKTRTARTLILSPLTVHALLKLLRERPQWWTDEVALFASETGKELSTTQWARRLRKYSEKAEVKITPYSLRHTFAIEFLKASNDPFALQRIMGHQDLNTTKRYIRYIQDDLKQILEKSSPVVKLQLSEKRAPRKAKKRN
ncbi:tyrosine-type recombinase/integrase [Thermoanaerobacter uzonensis]|uniref:tyrosine-type recombinase/integrase n=1 Tax=Thermoanaerobacter uzonensis TaxID=447593 RepID=UPI003D769D6B